MSSTSLGESVPKEDSTNQDDHDYCNRNTDKPPIKKKMHLIKKKKRREQSVQRQILTLRKMPFKTRLESATDMLKTTVNFPKSKMLNLFAKTSAKFRRHRNKYKFTLSEKITALPLFNLNPKRYSILAIYFTLPSSKSLKEVLRTINVTQGINKLVFRKIRRTAYIMDKEERVCVLIFDEKAIKPQIYYDATSDEIKGLSSVGDSRIADRVLTFMVRSVTASYEQPVAYYFTSKYNKDKLKELIKEVVSHVKSTGLRIVATVCSQSKVNIDAIDSLVAEAKEIFVNNGETWTNDVFIVDTTKIIPLYDAGHLLKGLRNNLLVRDLKFVDFKDENKVKVIKWEYFQQLYEMDKARGEMLFLYKLNENHVDPAKVDKNDVTTAVELLSYRIAAGAHMYGTIGKEKLVGNITPLAVMLDYLFDSLYCDEYEQDYGKEYKGCVKRKSPHHKLWADGIQFLKHMRFIDRSGDESSEITVPTIKCFIKTIEGVQAIWKHMRARYATDEMLCKHLTLYPINNFYKRLKNLTVVQPNTIAYENAFKTLLLRKNSNFYGTLTVFLKREPRFLQSLDFLLKKPSPIDEGFSSEEIVYNEDILADEDDVERIEQKSYACYWVLKKCARKSFRSCKYCKSKLFGTNIDPIAFVRQKEFYNKMLLFSPSIDFIKCFDEVTNITNSVLKRDLRTKNLGEYVRCFIDNLVSFPFDCDIHGQELKTLFVDIAVKVTIYGWCRSVNRILNGNLNYEGSDVTKISAQSYYERCGRFKKRKLVPYPCSDDD